MIYQWIQPVSRWFGAGYDFVKRFINFKHSSNVWGVKRFELIVHLYKHSHLFVCILLLQWWCHVLQSEVIRPPAGLRHPGTSSQLPALFRACGRHVGLIFAFPRRQTVRPFAFAGLCIDLKTPTDQIRYLMHKQTADLLLPPSLTVHFLEASDY